LRSRLSRDGRWSSQKDVFEIVREQARFRMPPPEAVGRGVSQEIHDLIAAGLEWDPDKRVLDLDRIASWVAPVTLDASASGNSLAAG